MVPKDKVNITQKSGVIYRYKWDRLGRDEEYMGESARTFGGKVKGTSQGSFPIYDHANTTGHHTRVDNFSTVGRESHNFTRTIKEDMYIKVNDPSSTGT